MSKRHSVSIVSLLFFCSQAMPGGGDSRGVCESSDCPVPSAGSLQHAEISTQAHPLTEEDSTGLLQQKRISAQGHLLSEEDSTDHSKRTVSLRCERDTGGTCSVFGCDASRNATCIGGACVCEPPLCNVGGTCKELSEGDGSGDEADKLSVLMFNTYLLKIVMLPGHSLNARSKLIADWFETLNEEALPDVLVLNEIFSDAGEALVQRMCSNKFLRKEPVGGFGRRRRLMASETQYPFIPCRSSSPFAFTTLANNARGNFFKGGGVVVLVRKGVTMEAAYDEAFTDTYIPAVSYGFWAVRATKAGRHFWVIATHAHPYAVRADVRRGNFAQMRAWVDEHLEDGSRVVFAGDMNVLTQPFTHRDCTLSTAVETGNMTRLLGAPSAQAIGGTLEKNGFWLPLDAPLEHSWHTSSNHFATHLYPEGSKGYEGDQMLDWVLSPGEGDRLEVPREFKRQVVPVVSSECFSTTFQDSEDDFVLSGTFQTTDLSDHYGIFALLCYNDVREGSCTWPAVQGHRGVAGTLPSPVDCGDEQPVPRPVDCLGS